MAAVEELSPFHRALAARRERYNAQFRLARSLDAEEFLRHLRDVVGPLVDAAGGDPVPVTDSLVDLSVALAGRRGVDGIWPLLRAVLPFVAAAPRRVPVSLANALQHLGSAPAGRQGDWIDTMVALAGRARGVDELLDAGAVAAWRCGLARLRASALDVAARLRAELLGIALGTSSTVDIDRLAADPWFDPGSAGSRELRVVRRVGSFRGFGGVFARPPLVSTSDGAWYATDGTDAWRVYADRFGFDYRRVAELPDAGQNDGLVLDGGRVVDSAGGRPLEVPELGEASSWASCGGTLAATTPWTHGILFVGVTA
jgi:hypothetical protein